MEGFCSLFDPTEGSKAQKTRHKTEEERKDPPKGRRRRRNNHKKETLPEESSFLCEPNLTSDILVQNTSYIDSYISPLNEDFKIKRRTSLKKSRRKKKESHNDEDQELNNRCNLKSRHDDNIGKNVNDLRANGSVRKEWCYEQKAVCEVIDKLDKVYMRNNMFLSGDFDARDLDDDAFYTSDDVDENYDSQSDMEDGTEEVYCRLPPEPRFGNVEYKLQLVNPCERRFQHLVTQLAWRVRSGAGRAVYVVGVRDCGGVRGLSAGGMRGSLRTLQRMCAALAASLEHVCVRRVAAARAVAEVYIRKLADTQQNTELRIAVMGANEAGKSTLIGVLTQGELDNGRGSARLNMFRHLHEVKSGNTSSLSHEILGFDSQGNVVNYGCSELMTAERIGEKSDKIVWFLDLAGHHKYQRTTVHGLTGYSPHYAMLLISATAGINRMTEEHIGLLLALDMPFFIVITKMDLAQNLDNLLRNLTDILEMGSKKKRPLLIKNVTEARNYCLAVDGAEKDVNSDDYQSVAVFPVSSVSAAGLDTLQAALLALPTPYSIPMHAQHNIYNQESCEFQIDEIFHVEEAAGPVVGGLLACGQLQEGDRLLIGPLESGDFEQISVSTIYRNRVNCGYVRAGQSASLGLSRYVTGLRNGMVLLAIPDGYKSMNYVKPTFGECSGGCKLQNNRSPKKEVRNKKQRKVRNNWKDVEKSSDEEKEVKCDSERYCSCKEVIMLEDPNDPRGCLFFQATVRVLRHSTAIYPGFQATVHIGNVRQTAVIEGIMSSNNLLRAGESASVVFRFVRQPEYLRSGRKMLFRDGLETHGVGRITQVFPYVP